ncbi:MAG: hypothetical protein CL840_01515 [Crocinitomicaceae bacterium]|nr:hypothetical protein [Crocinitomicaceae bacterium]|tara:strand:+ start:429 stop:2174 length:1746 start_codon:yes stop_codon:yes gene_type:complete
MKKLLIGVGVLLLLSLSAEASKKVIKMSVYFETDKHELNDRFINELKHFVQENTKGKDFELLVQGHADHRGDLAYNDALSLRRANTVKNFIGEQGISKNLIELSFYGERNPKNHSKSSQHLSQNRRVDVILNIYEFETLEEIQDALKENSVSSFELDPRQEVLLKANNGSRVYIQPNSFVDQNGNLVNERVTVEISEAIKTEEWVANNLSTKTNGELLESGGMLKISAITESGTRVNIDPNKPILVSIPKRSNGRDQRMEMFTSNAGNIWAPIGERPLNLSGVEMREVPKRRYANLNYPKYKVDQSSAPKRPKRPNQPSEPHVPPEIDVHWNVHWYTIFKQKKVDKNVAEYNNQLEKYYNRLERYKRNHRRYRLAELEYEKKLRKYESDLKLWNAKVKWEREMWYSTPEFKAAKHIHDSTDNVYAMAYRKQIAKWKEERLEKIESLAGKMDDLGLTNNDALNTYVFTMNELSWINVDRFMKYPANQKRDVIIADNDTTRKKVMLVFKDMNSTLQLAKNNNHYYKNELPKNQKIYVFAFKVKDGKPQVFLKPLESEVREVKLNFRPSSFAEIKKILADFDRG